MGDYGRILFQRNALLKKGSGSAALTQTLDVWDQSLARLWSAIVRTRRSYLEKLAPLASSFYVALCGQRESFSIRYQASADGIEKTEDILAVLIQNRDRDIRNGATGIGPTGRYRHSDRRVSRPRLRLPGPAAKRRFGP
jgi:DNA replication and repair protein RecF